MITFPPYLQKGDLIGITCPAGYMPAEKAATCIATLQEWGYEVLVGNTLGSDSNNYFSANDETRRNELQAMLDDDSVKAVLFGRGGYGMGRIIDQLNFKKFRRHPKWLIGFSDITVLHMHLLTNYNISSLHAPMAAAFNDGGNNGPYILSLKNALEGGKAVYESEAHIFNKEGEASGRLIGGNLALLANVIGTDSDFETKNRILFIEDTGEYIYNVDRMLYQLKRSGKLKKIKALIFGGFTDMKDTERPFGKSIEQVLKDLSTSLDCPVCFNFPVSHGRENVALKIGAKYHLTVSPRGTVLKELK